ncbi:hypothetical protein [Ralstonia pseudosolanacearum]|uniref:hypothetical protein n=1 Tax=Ralstonia pseudosolanacearum TaxID=1310165 RepID=UPI003CEB3FDE
MSPELSGSSPTKQLAVAEIYYVTYIYQDTITSMLSLNFQNAEIILASKIICHLLEKKILDRLFKWRFKFTKPSSTKGRILGENPNHFMGLHNFKYFSDAYCPVFLFSFEKELSSKNHSPVLSGTAPNKR